jgi:hypothetical protein
VLIRGDDVSRLSKVENLAYLKKFLCVKNASSKMHGTPIALS